MNNIKQLRKEKGLSQKQLAEVIGCSQPCVFNWEQGRAKPTQFMLQKLSQIFGVEPEKIFSDEINQTVQVQQVSQNAVLLSKELVQEMMNLTQPQQQRVLDFIAGLKSKA